MPCTAPPRPARRPSRREVRRAARRFVLVPVLLVTLAACSPAEEDAESPAATTSTETTVRPPTTTTTERQREVLLAVGDIASCRSDGDEATAALLDSHEGQIATLGDNVYERGTETEWNECFEPSWGRHKARIRPAPGNHDYGVRGAGPYYEYFGAAAGTPGEGWYSHDLGSWHIVVLNSVCVAVGGCDAGSPQEEWLRADLAAHSDAECTLAYWHHPRFSSGLHGSSPATAPLVQALYEAGADVVLAGHDHHYERFAPLAPDGTPEPEDGIRFFVVGTGGNRTYPIGSRLPGSEAAFNEGYGVLRLELLDDSYRWEFVGVPGVAFTDTGSDTCH